MADAPVESAAPRRVANPLVLAASLFLFVALAFVVARIREALILAFFSILLGTLLTFPIDFLARRLPRGVAVVLTLLTLAGAATGGTLLVAPAVSRQAGELLHQLPIARQQLHALIDRVERRSAVANVPEAKRIAQSVEEKSSTSAGELVWKALPAAMSLVEAVTAVVLCIALAFFFAHEPGAYRDSLRALVPRRYEPTFDETWRRVSTALRRWLAGILVSMLLMGTLTGLGLWVAGVEAWLALGVLTFFCTFVPYAGAVASAVPGLAVALAQSPSTFGWALVVYLCVHVVEGYLVEPLIMKRAVKLRPAVLLLWQMGLGLILGVGGIVIATPLLAVVQVGFVYLYVERALGKGLETDLAATGTLGGGVIQ